MTQPRGGTLSGALQGTGEGISAAAAYLRTLDPHKVILVGVGDDLRGDDGVGPWVVRRLAGRCAWRLFDAGTAPENFMGPLARLAPRTVVVIDAVHAASEPGAFWCGRLGDLPDATPSTHSASLALFAQALSRRCLDEDHPWPEFLLLGIQAEQCEFAAALSPRVHRVAAELVDALACPPT